MNALSQGVVIAAFLAFCRIGACFMLMPGLSSARVPIQIRLFVSVAATGGLLAFLWDRIYPFVDPRPQVLAPMIVSELLVGGLIGAMTRLYMEALRFMGSAIAMLIAALGCSGILLTQRGMFALFGGSVQTAWMPALIGLGLMCAAFVLARYRNDLVDD